MVLKVAFSHLLIGMLNVVVDECHYAKCLGACTLQKKFPYIQQGFQSIS